MIQTFLPVLFLSNMRGWQLLIVLLVILLLFGGNKIPEVMRSLGRGINSFKQGLNDMRDEIDHPEKEKRE